MQKFRHQIEKCAASYVLGGITQAQCNKIKCLVIDYNPDITVCYVSGITVTMVNYWVSDRVHFLSKVYGYMLAAVCNRQACYRLFKGVPVVHRKRQLPREWKWLLYSLMRGMERQKPHNNHTTRLIDIYIMKVRKPLYFWQTLCLHNVCLLTHLENSNSCDWKRSWNMK